MPFSILVGKTRPRRTAIEKTVKKPRNPRIEALRLVAIVAIAVFHTFQPWFAAAADASSELALSFPWLGNTDCLAVLGWLNLLGAYGNHVFYLISGYFLLPSAISGRPLRTGRKVMVILVSVLFYATLSLLLGRIVTMESVSLHQTGWLLGGLEFIWVYLALVLLTPLMAQVARRLPQWRRAVLVLAGVVFGLNAYIAFVSPGEADRGLLEWRKLMSAASYLVAYLTGAALSYEQARPAKAKRLLVGCILASAFIEGGLAAAGSPDLVAATSFKSTSLLSYLLAVASLTYARQSTGKRVNAPSRLFTAASSILGFYISQSMTADIWRPAFEHACARAALAGSAPSLLMCGIALSLADVCVVVLFDQLTRSKLLRLLKLS